jgi:hypothetical protein
MIVIDEQFVVYLFSLFHRELGFEHIVRMQTPFPDCIAVKDDKQVKIEFKRLSNLLIQSQKGEIVWRNTGSEVGETDDEFVVTQQGFVVRHYPKSEYKMSAGQDRWDIKEKVIKADYCVCWRINHDKQKEFKEEFNQVREFIALESKPIIIEFLRKRKEFLERLCIKDLAIEAEFE